MDYDKEKFEYVIEKATKTKNYSKQPTVRNAKDIFFKIKKIEKDPMCSELQFAIFDLEHIFKVDKNEIHKMSKTKILLEHQSKWVNTMIYHFINQ